MEKTQNNEIDCTLKSYRLRGLIQNNGKDNLNVKSQPDPTCGFYSPLTRKEFYNDTYKCPLAVLEEAFLRYPSFWNYFRTFYHNGPPYEVAHIFQS